MQIKKVIEQLEKLAPLAYQESYDNCGLQVGHADWPCTGILCTLDVTEALLQEAINKQCNLIVAHHPIIFFGVKKITGTNYVERIVITAIQNNIAIYAIHTNLDNVHNGVNKMIADKLGLVQQQILLPKNELLCKLYTYAPPLEAQKILDALFAAGAGTMGLYEECSFSQTGTGSFKALHGASPTIGTIGKKEELTEVKMEVVFPQHLQKKIVATLIAHHPYQTVAYEIVKLQNQHQQVGSGLIGILPNATTSDFLIETIKKLFNVKVVKHTAFLNRTIKSVAVCGGAGAFLTKEAMSAGADVFITSDVKYHEFFEADKQMLLADIGHWESEQFTTDLLANYLKDNFPTFAVLKTSLNSNPVLYS